MDVEISGEDGGRSFIMSSDLRGNKEVIYFGAPRDGELDFLKTDAGLEKNIVGVLNHEMCHILVYKLTNDLMTTVRMDNVDAPWGNWAISRELFVLCDERR